MSPAALIKSMVSHNRQHPQLAFSRQLSGRWLQGDMVLRLAGCTSGSNIEKLSFQLLICKTEGSSMAVVFTPDQEAGYLFGEML